MQLSCQYDVRQGVSRSERFRLQRQRQISVTSNLASLVDALRSSNDSEATTLLARLRLGDAVADIVKGLSTTTMVQQGSTIASPAAPPGSKSNPDLTMEFLDELLVSSKDLGVVSQLESPELQDNVGFLSVLFQQDEFSKTSKEHGTCTAENLSTPTTVTRADVHLRTANLCSLDSCETISSNDHEPVADTTSQVRALLAACSDDRCAHATWSTYPKVPDSLSIVPSCQVFPGEIASKEAHGLSSSNTLVPLWAMMSIHRKSRSDPMNAAFGSIHKAAANLLRKGIPAKEVFGAHPDIAALLSEKGHKNASLLSRWAASMVHSTRNKGFPLNFSIPLLQILT